MIILIVPDWYICQENKMHFHQAQKSTQIVTYTKGTKDEVSTLTSSFDHGIDVNLLTPIVNLNQNALTINVQFSSDYIQHFNRSHTHVFTLEKILVTDWKNLMPLRSQKMRAILPFDDEPINTTKQKMIPLSTPVYQNIRHIAIHSPLNLMQICADDIDKNQQNIYKQLLNDALNLDRSAHLWLSWSQMPKLESVFLDLRVYSSELNTEQKWLSKFDIIARAKIMGQHLQLKLLMIAGLQSYEFKTEYEGITAKDIEQWDEIEDEPNWIKIFGLAIREGGKVILVDKVID
ncbi:hypothetical protein F4861DRAFT_534821 [Xylaria intraflava]|nr:hypothetical protein F4861DRAFT_534821 [Xylaria intraflava]